MNAGKNRIALLMLTAATTVLSGCATMPSMAVQKRQTADLVMADHCHGVCDAPIQDQAGLDRRFQEHAFDMGVALRASADEGREIPFPTVVGNESGPDRKPVASPGWNGARLNLDAGIIAYGAGAPMAGNVLGGIGVIGSILDAPKIPHYHPWYRIPYLSFFRGYPKRWVGTQSMRALRPAFAQGYALLVATKDGKPVAPGSLDFTGVIHWGDRSQHHRVTHFTVSGARFSQNAAKITWSSNAHNDRILMAAFPVLRPEQGKNAAVFGILVRTGQPGSFYSPSAVREILRQVPGSAAWYALFNDPLPGGGFAQYAIHEGKLYRVSAY